MQLFTIVFERIPMVWVLLGLLFNAGGLYLGFDYSLAFAYIFLGWICCAYGVAVYFLQRRERPRQSQATRLSPNFISAGSSVAMPAVSNARDEQGAEQPDATNSD